MSASGQTVHGEMSVVSKREYLVFVRAGKRSLHREWMTCDKPEDRLWDVQISQYDDDPDIGKGGDLPLSVDKGTKWDSIYRYLNAHPEVMQDYKYILFIDDDIRTNCEDLNRFFKICDEYELLVAQPSLHPDSYFCYAALLTCPWLKLRFTNFVECMAPAIRTDYLKQHVVDNLASVKSGWGVDHVWTLWMDDPAYKSAIVDAVSVVHTRPHATGEKGSVYADLGEGAITPKMEGELYLKKFKDVPDRIVAYAAVNKAGKRIGPSQTRLLNGSYLLSSAYKYREKKVALKTGIGSLIRIATVAGYKPKQVTPQS